ncbi:MAG: FAD-binding oxidoreductase, partial [Rhodospirillaceae bacterium]|nr:FAD-binding oxidoreductase [Rhodospirillaceae bacterium]
MSSVAPTHLSCDELDRLKAIVGDKGWIEDPDLLSPYLEEQRGLCHGTTAIMLRPATTKEVSDVVSLCAESAIAIVPQGGNTGLVGGAVPHKEHREILLNLSRMNKISHVDSRNDTITVEAGCLLKTVQEAAENMGRLFPLSMGSEGSCEIGGNIATNAGGISVLRYGMMRDLVLGLEVVLADGRILSELKGLRKDNSGYDLRQIFIGSEGTLGIITAAVLKLFPPQNNRITALLGIASPQAAIALFEKSRDVLGDPISAFEYIPRIALDLVTKHIAGARDPFETPYPGYVLMELATTLPLPGLKADLELHLSTAIEEGMAENALIAESNTQAEALWQLREAIPEAQKC